jgi:hypothetical protein
MTSRTPTRADFSRTPTLAEWPYGMVRITCGLCPRRRQHRKGTLIRRFGGDVTMPDLRHLITRCPRKDAPGAASGVYYADLRRRLLPKAVSRQRYTAALTP